MNSTDYIVDILLIAVVFRQIRARPLTPGSILLPLVLVAFAGASYLRGFTLGGNDLELIIFFSIIGIVLGTTSALTTRVWREDNGSIVAKAGVLAATFWIIGMGFRFGFAIYANSHNGGLAIGRFSIHHSITSAQAWTTALVLMAFGEVLSRVAYLQIRRVQVSRSEPGLATAPDAP